MKKLSIMIASGLFLFTTTAFAEIGVNIGISGSAGLFGASAKETHTGATATSVTDTNEDTEIAAVGYGSIFLEKEIGIITIGVDYVPTPFESETTETVKYDDRTANPAAASKTQSTNKVQVDLTDLTSVYIGLNVTDSAYVKVGYATMDVETNEVLETGASYGNTSLDGTIYGVGYQKDLDAMFVRVEGTYMDFDGVSLSSGDNTITLKNLDGITGKISIGKSF